MPVLEVGPTLVVDPTGALSKRLGYIRGGVLLPTPG
jgi:hypothetical protein